MNKLFSTILLFCSASLAMAQMQKQTLDTWEFSRDSISWELVTVPHSTNALDGHSEKYYRGKTYYQKEISVTKASVKQPYYLLFEGAAQQSDIYLNGEKLTHHYGGYTAFTVDITSKLKVGENIISVTCDNHEDVNLIPVSSDFNKNNGLHNPVHLLTMPDIYIDPVVNGPSRIKAFSKRNADGTEVLTIQNAVRTMKDQKVYFAFRLRDQKGQIIAERFYNQKVLKGGITSASCDMTLRDITLWDGVNNPYLYTIEVEVISKGKTIDKASTRFGFRHFEMTADKGFILNGHPYPLRGVSMHQDMEGRASALTKEDYDRDYGFIKEIGANVVRLAHYPHNDYAFQLCDSLGLIVQTEIPWVNVCGEKASPLYFQIIRNQAEEMTHNLFNHPSICFWGMWNELDSWGNNDKLQGKINFETVARETALTYNTIRAIDAQRPIGVTDCSVYRNEGYKKLKANFYSENRYNGWYYDVKNPLKLSDDMNEIHANVSNHITNISEYGCGINPFCHSVDSTLFKGDADKSRHFEEYGNYLHESYWQQICQMPFLNFTTTWVMFDFAVAAREEGYKDSDDGISFTDNNYRKFTNDKGLVTRDRKTRKDVFYLYKAAWNKNETTVHITSTRMKKWPADRPVEVTVYSNAKSLTLYQNDKPVETMDSSGEVSGVIWKFKPCEFKTEKDTFRVVSDDGTTDSWVISPDLSKREENEKNHKS